MRNGSESRRCHPRKRCEYAGEKNGRRGCGKDVESDLHRPTQVPTPYAQGSAFICESGVSLQGGNSTVPTVLFLSFFFVVVVFFLIIINNNTHHHRCKNTIFSFFSFLTLLLFLFFSFISVSLFNISSID